MPNRIEISFFHDVLCAYCGVTAERLRVLRQEFGGALTVNLRPYPLRPEEQVLGEKELRRIASHVREAAKEPECKGMVADVWLRGKPPRSSMPPLIAAEAALLQGAREQEALVARLRTAAFHGGLDITRRDIILETASSVGLNMPRFTAAFDARATARSIEISLRDAIHHGVRAAPAITIGDEWLLTGVRTLEEYREVVLKWMERRSGAHNVRVVH
jgi:predicted DsbA family dithiol-disulfide isomerase